MAGTRLLAQLSFVLLVVALLWRSFSLLRMDQTVAMRDSLFQQTLNIKQTEEETKKTKRLVASLFKAVDEAGEEDVEEGAGSLFSSLRLESCVKWKIWSQKNSPPHHLSAKEKEGLCLSFKQLVNSMDDNYLPIRELRVNLILISEEKSNHQQAFQAVEDAAFSLEKELMEMRPLIPSVRIKFLEYPSSKIFDVVEVVNSNDNGTYSILSKSTMTKRYQKRDGFNFDHLRRTGIEPACLDTCFQLFIVLLRQQSHLQPLHIVKTKDELNGMSTLIIGDDLLLTSLNDNDFRKSRDISKWLCEEYIFPFLTIGKRNSVYLDIHNLLAKILHLERLIAKYTASIISLDEAGYYLRIKSDDSMLALFEEAVSAQVRAYKCLLLDDHNVSLPNMNDQFICSYHEFVRAFSFIQDILNNPNLVLETQEDLEFLYALTIPYWVPILIPVVVGTFVEVKRYWKKTS